MCPAKILGTMKLYLAGVIAILAYFVIGIAVIGDEGDDGGGCKHPDCSVEVDRWQERGGR